MCIWHNIDRSISAMMIVLVMRLTDRSWWINQSQVLDWSMGMTRIDRSQVWINRFRAIRGLETCVSDERNYYKGCRLKTWFKVPWSRDLDRMLRLIQITRRRWNLLVLAYSSPKNITAIHHWKLYYRTELLYIAQSIQEGDPTVWGCRWGRLKSAT